MGAVKQDEFSENIFGILSFILAKHHCMMTNVDEDTGIMSISGNSELSKSLCEEEIYQTINKMYMERGIY
ncbi:MAG: hypothetical protein ACOCQD_01170 [archaeon]